MCGCWCASFMLKSLRQSTVNRRGQGKSVFKQGPMDDDGETLVSWKLEFCTDFLDANFSSRRNGLWEQQGRDSNNL